MLERAKAFYRDHEPACTVAFFVLGFLFDTLFVGRIDRLHNVLHQASYLALCAWLIGLELREREGLFVPSPRLAGAWRYQKGATHFMLGTLLNVYTLFYVKSASVAASAAFLLLLAAFLAVNELKPFEESGTLVRMSLFSLCLVSYFTYLVPMAVGRIGALPFLGALACSGLCAWGLAALLERRGVPRAAVAGHVRKPFAATAAAFALLYALKVIPPVPLSLSEIGVYHDVRREGGEFLLSRTRPRWRFWEKGDQTFLARPGDRVHCYVSVFSPGRFRETLRLRWSRAGGAESDSVPLAVTGGRDGGFRSYATKANHAPGRWTVRVETSDGRELGRIGFRVVEDLSTGPRRAVVLRR